MITHILFDLGAVVVLEKINNWMLVTFQHVAEDFGFDKEAIASLYTLKQKTRVQTGLSLLDFYSESLEALDSNLDPRLLLERHMDLFRGYLGEHDEKVLNLVRALKKKYNVYYFTNTEIETFADVKKRGILSVFDGGFASTTIGFRKPNSESYRTVLRRLGVLPGQTFFTDDKKKNIDAANALGMHAFVYTGLEQLKKDLRSVGVEV